MAVGACRGGGDFELEERHELRMEYLVGRYCRRSGSPDVPSLLTDHTLPLFLVNDY